MDKVMKEFDEKFRAGTPPVLGMTFYVVEGNAKDNKLKSFLTQALIEQRKEIWDKVVKDIVFLLISEYSGCDPTDQLMEDQRKLYFRLIKERNKKLKQLSKEEGK